VADDKIKERIRRMLALAEDERNSPGERKNALARATELIAKHQIDRALLNANQGREEVTFQEWAYSGTYSREKSTLLGWLAKALGMKAVHWGSRAVTYKSHIYGFPSDLEMLDMLYTSLLLQQTTGLGKAKVPGYLYGAEVATWRRDWLRSFSNVVYHRVMAAHSRAANTYDAEHTGSGNPGAVMVLAGRTDLVTAAYEEAHPELAKKKAGPARKMRHRDAAEQGQEAGRRADIGLTKVGERRTQIGAGR
jgi:hypothetical protein